MTLSSLVLALLLAVPSGDRVIGHVGGQPIHESQVTGNTEQQREESLRALFVNPAMRAYLLPHREQIKLTDAEIESLLVAYRAAMACQPPSPVPQTP